VKKTPPKKGISLVIRSPHFWVLVAMFAIGIIFHYPDQIFRAPIFSGLTRHAMDRILFLVPIIYAGAVFGLKTGLASIAVALAIMLPRVFVVSSYPLDALVETAVTVVIGLLVNIVLERSIKGPGKANKG